jgi:hypothetical protein
MSPRDRWLILPLGSARAIAWDVWTAWWLIFTAMITPVEVAFLDVQGTSSYLFWINRTIDLTFAIDIVLQFFTIYRNEDGIQVRNHKRIALHYLKGWFLLDFISTAVSMFDLPGISDSTQGLKAIRVMRATRLLKLLRLAKGSEIAQSVPRTQYAWRNVEPA